MNELIQSRQLLERWLAYYDKNGPSAGLVNDTKRLIAMLPEPPRYLPTDDEVARMEHNGES